MLQANIAAASESGAGSHLDPTCNAKGLESPAFLSPLRAWPPVQTATGSHQVVEMGLSKRNDLRSHLLSIRQTKCGDDGQHDERPWRVSSNLQFSPQPPSTATLPGDCSDVSSEKETRAQSSAVNVSLAGPLESSLSSYVKGNLSPRRSDPCAHVVHTACKRQLALTCVGEIDRRAQAFCSSMLRSPHRCNEGQLANLRTHRPTHS